MKYSFSRSDPAEFHCKVALLRKGVSFCREQVKKAVVRFQTILHGDDVENTDQLAQAGDVSDINDDEIVRVMVATILRLVICLCLSITSLSTCVLLTPTVRYGLGNPL